MEKPPHDDTHDEPVKEAKTSHSSPENTIGSPISHHIDVPPSSPSSHISPKDRPEGSRRMPSMSEVEIPSPVIQLSDRPRELGSMAAYGVLVKTLELPQKRRYGSSTGSVAESSTEAERCEGGIKDGSAQGGRSTSVGEEQGDTNQEGLCGERGVRKTG